MEGRKAYDSNESRTMVLKRPTLSIVIPAYNRVKFLETEVDCFAKQIIEGGLENEVEIIISDDASKDGSSVYVKNIDNKYKFIKGWSNSKNLGFSGNVDRVVCEASGEYVLISGDDDLMRDGAITYFIKCIKEHNPNFVIINTSNILSIDDSNQKYKVILENRLKIDNDIFVENYKADKELLAKANNWVYLTNLLPAVIFKKELYDKERQTALEYVNPENVYLWQAQVLIGISKYGRLLVIGESYVLHRKNETNWTKNPEGIANINIFDSNEIGKVLIKYMPSEYRAYKKLFASFTLGELQLWSERKIPIREFALQALQKNWNLFPENLKFTLTAISPKLYSNILSLIKKLH